jgi:hypothetical protein
LKCLAREENPKRGRRHGEGKMHAQEGKKRVKDSKKWQKEAFFG